MIYPQEQLSSCGTQAMKSEVARLIQWVLFVLVILLHKSDADQGSYKCDKFRCGRSDPDSCKKKFQCSIPETLNITIVKPSSLDRCNEKDDYYGNEKDRVWTKHCCVISAIVCYKDHSNVPVSGNTTTAQHRTATEAANLLPNVTMDDDFNSTEIQEFQKDTGSLENENVSSIETVNALSNAAESQTSNVVLKVALPVGAFVLLILLAVICYVFRRKVNGLLLQFRGTRDKRPDQSIPVYGINGPAFGNTTSDKFDNLTYAMQTGQEHLQPGNFPTGGYEYSKPAPHGKVHGQTNGNPSNTVEGFSWSNNRPEYEEVDVKEPNELYDTTYQTLSDKRYNTSYDRITGSNAPTLTTPLAKLGGTAYDNAAI